MAVTLAIRFPLGRYHATPWDRNVNEGTVEWPPSPWRILRALLATWYTRWPELTVTDLDALLAQLGTPPAYRTPTTTPGHTRHYLPDNNRVSCETGATDLALDPFLSIPRDEKLLICWSDAELSRTQRAQLGKLAELMPYLGRAESVCEAQLVADETPDDTWWTPVRDEEHPSAARLLASLQPVRRAALAVSTVEVRKARRPLPEHSQWIRYRAPGTRSVPPSPPTSTAITALRYSITSAAPMSAYHGVLLADLLHGRVTKLLDNVDASTAQGILGNGGANTDHRHAHWIPLASDDRRLRAVVVWVPSGIPVTVLNSLLQPIPLNGRRGWYEIKGVPTLTLTLEAMGRPEDVMPELCRRYRNWHSATPYLPVRHIKKRDTIEGFLATDIQRELGYRHLPQDVTVYRVNHGTGLTDRQARAYRRHRVNESTKKTRPGLYLKLHFADPVAGPLLLGQLSHFGFGRFVPQE